MSGAIIGSDDAAGTIACLMLCIVNLEVAMPIPTVAQASAAEYVGGPQRRATPELIEFYRKRAHELRAEAIRNGISDLWSLLISMTRLHPRPWSRLRHTAASVPMRQPPQSIA